MGLIGDGRRRVATDRLWRRYDDQLGRLGQYEAARPSFVAQARAAGVEFAPDGNSVTVR